MTLPSSGPMSLSMIQGEFGGPSPILLSNYYRGGSYVPNTTQNASIPTSGVISLSEFYGTTKSVISGSFVMTNGSYAVVGPPSYNYYGWFPGLCGALVSNSLVGATPYSCYTWYQNGVLQGTTFQATISSNPGINAFSSISGFPNSGALTAASATYAFSGTTATWSWPSVAGFAGGGANCTIVVS